MENKELATITAEEVESIKKELVAKPQFDINTIEISQQQQVEMTTRLATMKTIAETIKKALVRGIDNDYDVITGCGKKPVLLQPGARKICLLFNLVPYYEIQNAMSDYDKPFQIVKVKTGWNNATRQKVEKEEIMDVPATFNYVIRCVLKTSNGIIVSTGIGQCTNREKGKADMPENSVIKMAKKRALIDAVLGIADMSAAFTQDLEDKAEATITRTTSRAVPPPPLNKEPIDENKEYDALFK